MKILINIGHPAHVHLFKNLIKNMEVDGHIIKIVTRDKDVTLELLDAYGLEYEVMSGYYDTMVGKMYDFVKTDLKLLKIATKTKPDMLIAVGDPYVAHVGRLIGKPSVVFTDTEHAKLANNLTFPFATVICTPSCFKKDLDKKQVRYNGYHELAYLHPNYFTPDSSILNEIGFTSDERFIILRFVAWSASHDVGHKGSNREMQRQLVGELEKSGHVLITSEDALPAEFERCRIKVPPEKMHDLLYYATLYMGEGGTMASEAALLGTPSVYMSSLAGTMGNFDELEKKYELMHSFQDPKLALDKALELLEDKNIKKKWQKKKERMLNEKIDVTKFMAGFIEGYPESFEKYKQRHRD